MGPPARTLVTAAVGAQPGPGLPSTLELASRALEAAAEAESSDDLFERMEAAGVLTRIDPRVTPTAYQAAIVSDHELEQLRGINRVVRLGHVKRIEPDRIICDLGEVPTTPQTLHIHCATDGLPTPPPKPVFEEGRITLQRLRHGLAPLSAAVIAYVEATRDSLGEKNSLCVPQAFNGRPRDWIVGRLSDMENRECWKAAPDLAEWYRSTYLGITAALGDVQDDPRVQEALARIEANSAAAEINLRKFAGYGLQPAE